MSKKNYENLENLSMGNTNNDTIIICYQLSDNKGCVWSYSTIDSVCIIATFVCNGTIFYYQ